MKLNRKFYARFFIISVLVCLLSMIGTYLIDTNFGSIITKDIKITDSMGHDIGLTIFQPKSATPEILLHVLSPCMAAIMDVKARTLFPWS